MKKYETQYDKMTKEPVSQLVVQLGIPTTISMLVTNIYNMVDTMFVGKLGTSASGAVGIVFGFMAILQAFGFMYGQGAGSTISRRLGSKDTESASRFASTSFFLSFFTGIVISILGLIWITPFMRLLGSTETILPYARTYVLYILLAAPFMTSCFTMNNILRFEGKASLAMIGLLSGAILNMVGDPLFMFVFDMGIAGAGLSTALSQVVSFCLLLYMFLSGRTQSKLSIHKFTKNLADVGEILAIGFPSMLRQGLSSISTMVLNQNAAAYGDAAVAAMSIVNRITMFMYSVVIGIGQGYQPVCGFNYGAKIYTRVKKAFRATWLMATIMMGVMSVIGLLLSGQLIGIFRDDAEVIRIGTAALRYQCILMCFQPICVLSSMTLQSTGQKLGAAFLALLRSGLFFIPMVIILTPLLGLLGIQIAQPAADILTVIFSIPFIIHFFRGLDKRAKLESVENRAES